MSQQRQGLVRRQHRDQKHNQRHNGGKKKAPKKERLKGPPGFVYKAADFALVDMTG